MKEYTLLAVLSIAVTVLCDRLLATRLLTRRAFWIFVSIMAVFMLIVNGYLTWRPIVLYGAQFFLGVRLVTIPLEDFLFGFSLVTLTIVFWEYFRGRRQNGTSGENPDPS